MDLTAVVIGLAALGVMAAVIAFLQTPPELRYRRQEPVEDGAKYAEQYTTRERVRLVAIALGVVLPLMGVAELWALPALEEFAEASYCYEWYGVSGTAVLIYGVFVGLPVLGALIIGMPEAYYGIRMIRTKQNPPPGTKVMTRTKIRRGRRAVAVGYANLLPLVFFVGLAIWSEGQAEKILSGFQPTDTLLSECPSNQTAEPTD